MERVNGRFGQPTQVDRLFLGRHQRVYFRCILIRRFGVIMQEGRLVRGQRRVHVSFWDRRLADDLYRLLDRDARSEPSFSRVIFFNGDDYFGSVFWSIRVHWGVLAGTLFDIGTVFFRGNSNPVRASSFQVATRQFFPPS